MVDENNFSLPVGPIEIPVDIFEKTRHSNTIKRDFKYFAASGFEIKTKKRLLVGKNSHLAGYKDISMAEDIVGRSRAFLWI